MEEKEVPEILNREANNFILRNFFHMANNDPRYQSYFYSLKNTRESINFATFLTTNSFTGPKHLKKRINQTDLISKLTKKFMLQPEIFEDIHRIMMDVQKHFGSRNLPDVDDSSEYDDMPGLEECH